MTDKITATIRHNLFRKKTDTITAKIRHNLLLRGHSVDHADTVLAWSTTTRRLCQRSQLLCRHVVNKYADTDKTTQTLLENFEGFSQILKEQSGEKKYLGLFTNPIAIILKYEIVRILRKICMFA